MLSYRTGSVLDSSTDVLVVPVLIFEVLDRGLGRYLADRYPGLIEAYIEAVGSRKLWIGQCWSWQAPDGRILTFLPVRKHRHEEPRADYFARALISLREKCLAKPRLSVAIELSDCGLPRARLNELLERYLRDCNVTIYQEESHAHVQAG